MAEVPLPGGAVSTVVRVGNTVRRPPAAPFVHRLLAFFQQAGWDGAPRFLGFDAHGREILSFVPGHVAWQPDQPAEVTGEASLVRAFHDLTAVIKASGEHTLGQLGVIESCPGTARTALPSPAPPPPGRW